MSVYLCAYSPRSAIAAAALYKLIRKTIPGLDTVVPGSTETLLATDVLVIFATKASVDDGLMNQQLRLAVSPEQVAVFLVDIAPGDLPDELQLYQGFSANREETWKLLGRLSRVAEHEPDPSSILQAFEIAWPEFVGRLNSTGAVEEESAAPENNQTTAREAPTKDPGAGEEDTLLRRLLKRRLAVSTLHSNDANSALNLIHGPETWGLGPEIDRGDFLLIYFPKTLTKDPILRAEFGTQQPYGLRHILRAGSHSRVADTKQNYRQIVSIADIVELENPIDPAEFNQPPLNDWGLAKVSFKRAGRQKEPLSGEIAEALWRLILERNAAQRGEIEALLDIDPTPQTDSAFEMRNVLTRDIWTTDDRLGYDVYAEAITGPIENGSTVPPLTVGIQAPWGQGKTSLMRMIQKRFDPEGPKRDSRKLETNGETAVRATYGKLRGWLRQYGKSKANLHRAIKNWFAKKLPNSALADQKTQESKNQPKSWEPWQIPERDMMPGDNKGTYRRPGLLIDKKRRIPTVWFNPLYYGTTEQIWAGLAHAMLQELSSQLDGPLEREEFWFRLQLKRINVDAVLHDLRKVLWLRFLPWVAIYALVGLTLLSTSLIDELLKPIGINAVQVSTGVGFWALLHGWIFSNTAGSNLNLERQFEKYVSEPDYRSELGLLYWVDHDLDRALDLLCGDYPVAVFIDDLDRCDPKIVAEIIFAINQFLSLPRRNVFFFLGMDTQMVAAALESARNSQRVPSAVADEPHQSFGWRFMEKFVQLPFVIPRLDDRTAKRFAASKLNGPLDPGGPVIEPEEDVIAEEVLKEMATIDNVERLASFAKDNRDDVPLAAVSSKMTELMQDPKGEEIREIVDIAIDDLDLNPRTITRYFGLLRVLRNLQVTFGLGTNPHRDRMIVLRAAHLLLNWPEAMQWLDPNKSMASKHGGLESAIAELENEVAARESWREWAAFWQEQPDAFPQPFKDHRLYQFLRKIGGNPPGLLEIYQARLF